LASSACCWREASFVARKDTSNRQPRAPKASGSVPRSFGPAVLFALPRSACLRGLPSRLCAPREPCVWAVFLLLGMRSHQHSLFGRAKPHTRCLNAARSCPPVAHLTFNNYACTLLTRTEAFELHPQHSNASYSSSLHRLARQLIGAGFLRGSFSRWSEPLLPGSHVCAFRPFGVFARPPAVCLLASCAGER